MIDTIKAIIATTLALALTGCLAENQPSKESLSLRTERSEVCRIGLEDYKKPGNLVLDRWEIDRIMRGDIIDAPISIMNGSSGTPAFILPTAMQQAGDIYLAHTIVEGDLADLEASNVYELNEHKLFENSPQLTNPHGRHWITNLMETPQGVLAFLHTEYSREGDFFGMGCSIQDGSRVCAPGLSKLSLAWMPRELMDKPRPRFTVLGNIAGSSSLMPHLNVHGTPVYVNETNGEAMINILFADAHGVKRGDEWVVPDSAITRARAPLDTVIAAAQEGRLTPWTKLNNGEWVDALTGTSTTALPLVPEMAEIDPRIAKGNVIVHSDATFHAPSSSYVLSAYTLNRPVAPSSLLFYTSCDGETWRFAGRHHPRDDAKAGWSYLSLVGRDETDGVNINAPLDLISGWDYGKEGRAVYRMRMSIPESCACP